MTTDRDHYQNDGFEKVRAFSGRNAFVAIFLALIVLLITMDVWFTPKSHDVQVKEDVVIPWKPHPPLEHEPLYR